MPDITVLDFGSQRSEYDKHYNKQKAGYEKRSGRRGLFRVIVVFVLVQLLLYFLLAASPGFMKRMLLLPPGVTQAEPHHSVSTFVGFREYLGRSFGVIPADCAATDKRVVQEKCEYRISNNIAQFLSGAISLVSWTGAVQKVTIFMLILGLVLVARFRYRLALDMISFPSLEAYERKTSSDPDHRFPHPAAATFSPKAKAEDERLERYIYPPGHIDARQESGVESARALHNQIAEVMEQIKDDALSEPLELIRQVVARYMQAGRARAAERMDEALFLYEKRVQGGFWKVDYLLWFLPTVGFLGTIYGISAGLVRAKGLFGSGEDGGGVDSESINTVVDGLGVAFDTTSTALACAAVLYLALRLTEARIPTLTRRASEALDRMLLDKMRGPSDPTPTPDDPKDPDAELNGETKAPTFATAQSDTTSSSAGQ